MLDGEVTWLPGGTLAKAERDQQKKGSYDEPEDKANGQQRNGIASDLWPETKPAKRTGLPSTVSHALLTWPPGALGFWRVQRHIPPTVSSTQHHKQLHIYL